MVDSNIAFQLGRSAAVYRNKNPRVNRIYTRRTTRVRIKDSVGKCNTRRSQISMCSDDFRAGKKTPLPMQIRA